MTLEQFIKELQKIREFLKSLEDKMVEVQKEIEERAERMRTGL